MRITGQYRLSLGRLLQYKIIIKNPDRLYRPKWARLHARVSDTNDIITVTGMYVYPSYHLTKITGKNSNPQTCSRNCICNYAIRFYTQTCSQCNAPGLPVAIFMQSPSQAHGLLPVSPIVSGTSRPDCNRNSSVHNAGPIGNHGK